MLKKLNSIYKGKNCHITVNEEISDHLSVHDYGEACSGILKTWGSKKELIKKLEDIIQDIKNLD